MKPSKIFGKIPIRGLFCILLTGTIINLVNVLSLLLVGVKLELIGTLLKYLSMGFIAISLINIFKSSYKCIIISLIIFSALWIGTAYYYPLNIPFLQENWKQFFLECLPYLWIFYYFFNKKDNEDGNVLFGLLYKLCKVKLILSLLAQTIMFIFPWTDIFNDYMDSSFAILFGLLFITGSNIKNKHSQVFDTFLEVLGILSIIILGSRGGMLCYASMYVINYILLLSKSKYRVKVILTILACVLLVLIVWPLFISYAASSDNRALLMLSSSTFLKDENRSILYELLVANILNYPLGLGVMSDRVIISEAFPSFNAYYAHNIFLEIIVDFGILGIIASLYMVVSIAIKLFKPINVNYKFILLSLCSTSLIKLLVSSSFWLDSIFWAMIGVLIACTKKSSTLNKNINT